MEFFIKKGSTEPILKMAVVEDGRGINHEFMQKLENTVITFSMKDKNDVYKIYRKSCSIISKINESEINPLVYYIYYKWDSEDTDELGTFEGEFAIKFYGLDGEVESTLLAPIREKLIINVI
jgi:hypothetical protein